MYSVVKQMFSVNCKSQLVCIDERIFIIPSRDASGDVESIYLQIRRIAYNIFAITIGFKFSLCQLIRKAHHYIVSTSSRISTELCPGIQVASYRCMRIDGT